MFTPCPTERSRHLADRVEAFVRDVVIPYERDQRRTAHGPSAELVDELRARAREAGLMTPHILADGSHLTQLRNGGRAQAFRPVAARPGRAEHRCTRRRQHVPARQDRHARAGRPVPGPAGSRRCPVGVLHDRTVRRRRRRIRSVDAADRRQAGRRRLDHRRPQDLHHRRRRRPGRHPDGAHRQR